MNNIKWDLSLDTIVKVGVGIIVGAASLFGIAVFATKDDDGKEKNDGDI